MNLEFTPEEVAFRKEVREFIEKNYPERLRGVGAREDLGKDDMLAWHQILGEKGWSVPAWPEKYGGTGWTPKNSPATSPREGKEGKKGDPVALPVYVTQAAAHESWPLDSGPTVTMVAGSKQTR